MRLSATYVFHCHSHHACWSPGVAWIDCGRSTQQASSRNGFTGRPSLKTAPAVFFKGCPSVLGAVVSAAEGEDAVEGLLLCCLKSLNLRSRSKFKMQNSSVCLFSAVHLLLFTLKYAR